jgi:hypothetical protein
VVTFGIVARAGSTVTNLMLACTIATNAPFRWLLVILAMTVTSAKRLNTELGRIGMDRRHGTMVCLLTVTIALQAPIRYMQTLGVTPALQGRKLMLDRQAVSKRGRGMH